MRQPRHGPGFYHQLAFSGRVALGAEQQFDRHLALELRIPGEINAAVITPSQFGPEFKATKTGRFGLRHNANYRTRGPLA